MAAHSSPLGRFASGPLHGVALAIYFALLPYVVVHRWSLAAHQSSGPLIRTLLIALALFWVIFLVQLLRNVVRLRQGRRVGAGGSVWLAGLVVAVLSVLVAPASPLHRGSVPPSSIATPTSRGATSPHQPHPTPASSLPFASAMSAIPFALAAKRRGDLLRRESVESDDSQIDGHVALLRGADPRLLDRVRGQIGARRDGVLLLDDTVRPLEVNRGGGLAVCVLSDNDEGVLLAFAREGGCLQVPASWTELEITDAVVALHDGGQLRFTHDEPALLRTLATRTRHNTLVIYLGSAGALDDELRACAVTLERTTPEWRWTEVTAAARGAAGGRRLRLGDVARPQSITSSSDLCVEMLRADPRVVGLVEPFTATLRRRCVEMTAYLALHRHEPVTGDRLRTRVLTHADVDASTRTLANTASAVRRSLGVDREGPRLQPVTSAGLYITHGLSSDVESFHGLVASARRLTLDAASPLIVQALTLVQGEPLASALRGFEWFLAEGHAVRLRRDGEWAALALARFALDVNDVELAFWALAQGRLVDPYSDELTDELARVPRLRQFVGDRTGRAQYQSVGPDCAVVARRAPRRLGDEVVQ